MTAGIYNFTIEQGADFSRTLTWQDSSGTVINLTGYSAAMQIRDRNGSLILDVATLSGGLTVNGSAGQVVIAIPAATTSTLDFDTADYDLKLTSSAGAKDRLVEGVVTLSKEVTQ